jgi:hypothetical protein
MPLPKLHSEIPGEITKEELETAASKHGWGNAEIIDFDTDEYWSIKYSIDTDVTTTNCIEVGIEPVNEINGEPLNNVFVRGDTAVPIDTYDDFTLIKHLITDNEQISVNPHISEGHWEMLAGSDRDVADENNIPHEDVFNTLTDKGVKIGAVITYLHSTQEIGINELIEAVETITETYRVFE